MGKSRSTAGGAQFALSVTTGAVVSLTIPDTAQVAQIFVRGNSVTFLRDGTDPTSTKGIQADPSDIILLNSRDELDKFKVLAVSATATLDVEYFTDLAG